MNRVCLSWMRESSDGRCRRLCGSCRGNGPAGRVAGPHIRALPDFATLEQVGHYQTVKTFPAGLEMPAQVGEAICTHGDAPGESGKPRSLVSGDAVEETSPCSEKTADMETNAQGILKNMRVLTVYGNAIIDRSDLVSAVLAND